MQEILCVGDPEVESSLGIARVIAGVPDSSHAGLVVRQVGHSTTVNVSSLAGPVIVRSSAADALVTVYQSTVGALRAAAYQSTVGDLRASVYQSTAADLNVTVAGLVAPTTTATVRQSTYSDLNAQTIEQPWSTTARSSVTQSSTNVTLQAASTARRTWTCYNRPTQNASLHVKFGATASTTDFDFKILPEQYYEMPQPVYHGLIDGIWDSTGAGYARIVQGLN